ncbi:2-dehydro-3-deoxy-D-arabinonate dehydratase [Nakamurella panacisegetis]|uniref:2-dehydro-3-deoxy-D-arabinonate dehydratase n=1 Tax=Nakamurella panacisegetis TaxID=1090615 RepID=A0A1H0NH28_9ACTN|nr:fumarylacetoacetate hydrolase family protein [Nakamurella panacisegetis]SDO91974.1 2-dehydro-3-deoxy-D-arabinonate dehydratase [Nakamurella panacisegetis]
MEIIRYVAESKVHVGIRSEDGTVRRLAARSLAELLRLPFPVLRALVETGGVVETADLRMLPPVDGLTEVWASGVTYRRSSMARQEESVVADVYARVYEADRPELFFKSVPWRVVGHDEPIGVRPDSEINVPEAELAVVVNAAGEIVGATICDDVSSRSIEGENPLYLPQAKVYSGSCAIGPGIRPIWEIEDLQSLNIQVRVERSGETAWAGSTNTDMLNRTPADLVGFLRRHASFPDGVVLSTGTGLVPEMDFDLQSGDTVVIEIESVGVLSNPVIPATTDEFAWLTPDPARAP